MEGLGSGGHSGRKQGRRREDKATAKIDWLKSCCLHQVTGKKVKGEIGVANEREQGGGVWEGVEEVFVSLASCCCCQAEAAAPFQASLPSSLKMHAGVGMGVLEGLSPGKRIPPRFY